MREKQNRITLGEGFTPLIAAQRLARELRVSKLIPKRAATTSSAPSPIPFPARMEEIEKEAALAMVRHCDGNKTAAASALGISRARLYRLIGEEGA